MAGPSAGLSICKVSFDCVTSSKVSVRKPPWFFEGMVVKGCCTISGEKETEVSLSVPCRLTALTDPSERGSKWSPSTSKLQGWACPKPEVRKSAVGLGLSVGGAGCLKHEASLKVEWFEVGSPGDMGDLGDLDLEEALEVLLPEDGGT
mmetsp:Transcript_45860/g.109202  ORF Transcript_45860/g.109202 Transcript_45860/m.109202 type:complete len:148 (-) Transcript_45860:653-1096(-)